MSSRGQYSDKRNVILIILDTVRKDYFDQFANRIQDRSDLSFENCRSASTWSVPSHASIFTGELPHVHGVHAESFGDKTNFNGLSENSFLTNLPHYKIGLSANPYANSGYGFDSLFDDFQDFVTHESLFPAGLSPHLFNEKYEGGKWKKIPRFVQKSIEHEYTKSSLINGVWNKIGIDLSRKPVPGLTDDGANVITNTAIEKGVQGGPFFMFINYMDAHAPLKNLIHYDSDLHNTPNNWTSDEHNKWEINKDDAGNDAYFENYRDLYGAAIDYLDRKVSDLVDSIVGETEKETTVIITSDHGHNLGYPSEDNLIHHEGNMSEGLLHVPLEIINPPAEYPNNVEDIFSHLSLGTLIQRIVSDEPWSNDLIRDETPAEVIGLTGVGDPRNYRDFEPGEYEFWNRLIRCVYKGQKKYQWDSLGNQAQFFVGGDGPCSEDPCSEAFDIEPLEGQNFNSTAEEYKKLSEAPESRGEEGVLKERLQDLGYM